MNARSPRLCFRLPVLLLLACVAASLPAASAQTSPVPPPQQAAPPASSQTAPAAGQAAPAGPSQTAAPASGQVPPGQSGGQGSGQTATPTGQQGDQGPIFTLPTVRVNLVNLVFTVTDKKGRFKKDLRRENFGLLDDGRSPSSVVSFTQQTDLPLRLGIMLDTSTSIRSRFKFEQDAALDFFLQVIKSKDRAFVEGFDVKVELAQDYTANIDSLSQGIAKLRPGGGTALYDSLYTTCRDQMLGLREGSDVRRVIILVSDGDDDWSRAAESDAIKMCQRAETAVYAISTDTSPSKGKGGEVLSTIADATGGRAFFPDRLENLSASFRDIEEELRSQYSLAYRPANFKQDGSFRTIYLRAVDPQYHVRARTGYFAPKATP